MAGVGPGRYSILCYWLIPKRNTKDGVRIDMSLVLGSGVLCTTGLERGSNRRIILGGSVFDNKAFCMGLLGCTAYGGVVPTAV